MKLSFRQGVIRYQRDPQGVQTFLQRADGGSSVHLLAGTDPTLVTIAHHASNYIVEERSTVLRAWTGFTAGRDYWLYIDISLLTGKRTFGWTLMAPSHGAATPSSPTVDQHWFDTTPTQTVMKVFNGTNFTPVLRVFLARYQNGVTLIPYNYGTQVGLNVRNEAGHILFDNEGHPLRGMKSRTSSEFFTTASIFSTGTSKSVNVSLDALCTVVQAAEPIPAFSLVTHGSAPDEIALASSSVHNKPAIGIVQEDFYNGETGIYSSAGYVTNEQWNWTQAPGTALFLGDSGEIITDATQRHVIQAIGSIVSPRTILLDIQPQVHYDVNQVTNLVPLNIDRSTGKLIATSIDPASGQLEDGEYKAGWSHTQTEESVTWTIDHFRGSVKYVLQVFDSAGFLVYPDNVETKSANQIVVTFTSPQTGTANVVFFDATLSVQFYDVAVSVTSAVEINETLAFQPIPSRSMLDLESSFAYSKTPADAVLNITVDGNAIGTIAFSASSNVGVIDLTDSAPLNANQILEITAPSVPTTLNTIGLRLRFTNIEV